MITHNNNIKKYFQLMITANNNKKKYIKLMITPYNSVYIWIILYILNIEKKRLKKINLISYNILVIINYNVSLR